MKRKKPKATTPEPWPKRSQSAPPYGLTAVTLGDVLKSELDKVAEASKENRSEIIRRALEQYLEKFPDVQKRRQQDREKARDLQVPVLFSKILEQFDRVMRHFAYPDALPLKRENFDAVQTALDRAREWLAVQLPSDLRYDLPSEVELALSDIRRGFHRLFVETDKADWQQDAIARWRGTLQRNEQPFREGAP